MPTDVLCAKLLLQRHCRVGWARKKFFEESLAHRCQAFREASRPLLVLCRNLLVGHRNKALGQHWPMTIRRAPQEITDLIFIVLVGLRLIVGGRLNVGQCISTCPSPPEIIAAMPVCTAIYWPLQATSTTLLPIEPSFVMTFDPSKIFPCNISSLVGPQGSSNSLPAQPLLLRTQSMSTNRYACLDQVASIRNAWIDATRPCMQSQNSFQKKRPQSSSDCAATWRGALLQPNEPLHVHVCDSGLLTPQADGREEALCVSKAAAVNARRRTFREKPASRQHSFMSKSNMLTTAFS